MIQRGLVLALALLGCTSAMDEADEIYARADGQRVLCGLGVDGESIALDEIQRALQRAAARDEVLILFAHEPGRTIAHERLDDILELAAQADVGYVTFPELVRRGRSPGLAFGFDDASVEAWFGMRDTFARHAARVTFFVSNYAELDSRQREMLKVLNSEGHAIEAHGMGHRNAPVYAERYGLGAYLAHEIEPLLETMARDGFHPTTFAYPYGDRTEELDRALLGRFELVRSLSYLDRGATNCAPCPH